MLPCTRFLRRYAFQFGFSRRATAENLSHEKSGHQTRSVAHRRPHQRLQLCGERELRFAQYHAFNRL